MNTSIPSNGSPAGQALPAGVSGQPVLELRDITKLFPAVRALDKVTLDVRPGEVLALVGENGAGKSTLLRVLNGDYQPDAGEIYYQGQPIKFASPRVAHSMGIRVIYQEPELVPGVSIAENIYLGELPRRFGPFVDWRSLRTQVHEQLARLNFEGVLDPKTLAETLSPAQRQFIEILKALKSDVRVLALDEPTSSLTEQEVRNLMAIVQHLRNAGVAIIYISHRIKEILRLADRIAVLRDGSLVAVRPARETTEDELVRLMVGRPLNAIFHHTSHCQDQEALRVEELNSPLLQHINFTLHKGEVLGIAGLIGSGRTELAKTLFGALPMTSGRILLDNTPVHIRNPRSAMAHGIGFAPEDRKAEALLLDRSVKENVSISNLSRLRRWRLVNKQKERRLVSAQIAQLRVKTSSIEKEVGKLSGGNQQKVVLARWLLRKPRVLILDEPTQGIDVGAKSEIYQLIEQLVAEGIAIIFISSELPEVLGVSDRILVMAAGRISGELRAREATEESILALAMANHLTSDTLSKEAQI